MYNNFTTTNSTYGNFYRQQSEKIEEEKEKNVKKAVRQRNNITFSNEDYKFRNKNVDLPAKDSSLVKNISSSLIGLRNLGNTCYINSCIQNLVHCIPFIKGFLEKSNKITQNNKALMSNSFYELLLNLYESQQEESIDPSFFVNNFFSLHGQFNDFQQHDTQEFCRFFLQDLNYELNDIISPSCYHEERTKGKSKKETFICYQNDCLSKEYSIIQNLFIGYFSFEYICECGYKEYSFSQFLDLPIQMNEGNQDLYQMIKNNFYKKSYVDMGENCNFCKRTSKKNEIMRIASLPKILIISLQRINPKNGTKNKNSIKYYENIDFKEIIDSDLKNSNSTKYNLFAVTNHIGEINSGHYFSQIKIGNFWYCFEDSKVFKIGTQINMNNNEVYSLFYQRNE